MTIETVVVDGFSFDVPVPDDLEELAEKVRDPDTDIFELARQSYMNKVRQFLRYCMGEAKSLEEIKLRLEHYKYGSLKTRTRDKVWGSDNLKED